MCVAWNQNKLPRVKILVRNNNKNNNTLGLSVSEEVKSEQQWSLETNYEVVICFWASYFTLENNSGKHVTCRFGVHHHN